MKVETGPPIIVDDAMLDLHTHDVILNDDGNAASTEIGGGLYFHSHEITEGVRQTSIVEHHSHLLPKS